MTPTLHIDLRCLQDTPYRLRGIGRHVTAFLRTREQSGFANSRVIGLVDPALDDLPPEYASLVDELSGSANPSCNNAPAIFVDPTPMTHDWRFSARYVASESFFRVAIVYDFVPLDWPGYFGTIGSRMTYLAKMARLRRFDLFLPISEFTARRTSELLGIPRSRMAITGSPVRTSLYDIQAQLRLDLSPYEFAEPYFLTVIANDARKNPAAAIKAVRNLNLINSQHVPLKIVGLYYEGDKAAALKSAGYSQKPDFIEFCDAVPDEELASLYAGAIATIVPSYMEGFSLPVVEAAVCRCPAVVSTCDAHLELINEPAALFSPDDTNSLTKKLEALLSQPRLRSTLLASQSHLGAKFHEIQVGERCWKAIQKAGPDYGLTRSNGSRAVKPRIAFLTADPEGVAGGAYGSRSSPDGLTELTDTAVFTDAARPLRLSPGRRDGGRINVTPFLAGNYDGIISILHNDAASGSVLGTFERFGGPCILKTSNLSRAYYHFLGADRFRSFASDILRRPATNDEIHHWLAEEGAPIELLDRVVRRSSPLIVFTTALQRQVDESYGVSAKLAPSFSRLTFREPELEIEAKLKAKKRLALPQSSFIVIAFGDTGGRRELGTTIQAVELTRSWGLPTELYFVGNCDAHKRDIQHTLNTFHIHEHVSFAADARENTYRDFLLAADCSIQLGGADYGYFPHSLSDSISAGRQCVCTLMLAESAAAPAYVLTVPDRFSALLVAEQLAVVYQNHPWNESAKDERRSYLETHNVDYFARWLMEAVGLS